jgi:hypothetical protein
VDQTVGPILRPSDDPAAFEHDHTSDMSATTYDPAAPADDDEATAPVDDDDADAPYEDLTVEQLRGLAREQGIAYTGLNKAELVDALYEADADADGTG